MTSLSPRRSPVPLASTGMRVLRGSGAVLMLLVGAAILWQAGRDGSAFGVIFAVFLAGLGLLGLLQLALEAARRGGGTRIGVAPDGEPATVLPRRAVAPVLSGLALLLLGGCLVSGAVVAGLGGRAALAVVLAVLGLPLLGYLAAVLAGRMPAGGVYLTTTGITDSHSGCTTRVGWDDVVAVWAGSPTAVGLRPGAAVRRTRTAPPGWRGGVRAPEDVLGIDVRHLREDPAVLAYLLEAYRTRPDLRDRLGTPASLEWEILRTGS